LRNSHGRRATLRTETNGTIFGERSTGLRWRIGVVWCLPVGLDQANMIAMLESLTSDIGEDGARAHPILDLNV
jgi:hypothetical protein